MQKTQLNKFIFNLDRIIPADLRFISSFQLFQNHTMLFRLSFARTGFFLFLTFISLNSFSQENIIGLKPFIEAVKFEAQMTSVKAFLVKEGKSKTINIKDLPPIIDGFIINYGKKVDNKNFKEAGILARNRGLLKKYVDEIYSFANSTSEIHYNLGGKIEDITYLPIGFAQFNNSLVFYQSSVYYDKILNNLKLSADERASLIAKECIIPSLNNFKPLLDNNGIKYFSLIYSYVAKDFSSDEMLNADGETVTIIISRELLKKLINLEVTPEDVYAGATFYNSNKNTDGNLRKITIK